MKSKSKATQYVEECTAWKQQEQALCATRPVSPRLRLDTKDTYIVFSVSEAGGLALYTPSRRAYSYTEVDIKVSKVDTIRLWNWILDTFSAG